MALIPLESRSRLLTVVGVTFILATAVTWQVKTELIPTSNHVARDQALVRSVNGLDSDNAGLRTQIREINATIARYNTELSKTSSEAAALQQEIAVQRETAGLTPAGGPGMRVDMVSGRPPQSQGDAKRSWEVGYVDIQDVVNLLWSAGAEAIAVNGQRVVPTSSFYVAGADVLLNGIHLSSPYRVEAIGDSSRFNEVLSDGANLADLKSRSALYQLKFAWSSQRTLRLPAYEGAFVVRYALAG